MISGKITISTLLLVLFVLIINKNAYSGITFRVQCIQENTKSLQYIPEKSNYLMPGGQTIYFSGGYYSNYDSAYKRMNYINEKGLASAYIRVFNNREYLSDLVSTYLLNEFLAEKNKNIIRNNNVVENKNIPNGTIAYSSSSKINIANNQNTTNGKLKNQNNELLIDSIIVKNVVEIKNCNPKTAPSNFPSQLNNMVKITEPPVFKILVAEKLIGGNTPSYLQNLSELIYEHNFGNKTFFTVGHFFDINEAISLFSDLHSQINKYDVKLIGMYKGSFISVAYAEILKQEYEAFMAKN